MSYNLPNGVDVDDLGATVPDGEFECLHGIALDEYCYLCDHRENPADYESEDA